MRASPRGSTQGDGMSTTDGLLHESRTLLVAAGAEITRLRAELARYQRAHKSTCPGCDLCLRDFRDYPQRARPELDLDSAGRPLRPGS